MHACEIIQLSRPVVVLAAMLAGRTSQCLIDTRPYATKNAVASVQSARFSKKKSSFATNGRKKQQNMMM